MPTEDQNAASAIYARLWADAQAQFAQGQVITDPHLDQREADTRRGLTLLLRPGGEAKARITAALDELRALAPRQHLYHPAELHITVLSVISAALHADLSAAPVAAFHAAFTRALAAVAPFTVRMTGISAAPDAVFVYGESEGDALNVLRERVRDTLHAAGLDAHLERRYRSVTAHMTVCRFRSTPADLPALVDYLKVNHTRDIGTFTAQQIDFVSNDWYMSRDIVRVLHRYPLSAQD